MRAGLTNRTLGSLGKYSYAIYVFHLPVIVTLHDPLLRLTRRLPPIEQWAAAIAAMLAVTALVFALAFASYHLFEKHFLAQKGLFAPRGLREKMAAQSGYA